MAKIGVIGTGIIGRSWSILFARAGYEVALFDSDAGIRDRAVDQIAEALALLERNDPGFVAQQVMRRIHACGMLDAAVRDAIHVQENVPERSDIKTEVFEALDRLAPPGAVLASSTSTLPPSGFLGSIAGRHRCLVAHPGNPPHLIPIVELIPGPWTSSEAVAACEALLRECGQSVITLKREIPGFVFNRLQGAMVAEAMRLIDQGVASAEDIDLCVREGLGLRWAVTGPLETMDLASAGGFAESAQKYIGAVSTFWPGTATWAPETSDDIDRWCRSEYPLADHLAREQARDAKLIRIRRTKAG